MISLLTIGLRKRNLTSPLKGFEQHGVHFNLVSETQGQGVCPFCFKDKFFVNPDTLLWDCKVCVTNGNFQQFLSKRMIWYKEQFKGEAASALSRNRNLSPQTLRKWNIGYDPVSKYYMLPCDGNNKRTIKDVHRFTFETGSYSTAGAHKELFASSPKGTQTMYLAEGLWDSAAVMEAGITDDIYGCPGAGAFPKEAVGLFSDKDVILLGQYDPINPKNGKRAAYAGMQRTGNLLSGLAKSIRYLHWKDIPDENKKFDLRDLLTLDKSRVISYIKENLKNTCPDSDGKVPKKVPKLLGKSISREEAIKEYRKWLYINNPEVLDVVFGSVFANRINVDPLWMFIVGAPGSGKTELLMSLSDADKVVTTTTITPPALISGQHTTGADPSLIPKLDGKVLVIKDFTTILNMNESAREEIFGIFRDAYDGKITKHFGNGVRRSYESRFGVVAGVTPVIEALSKTNSLLGERFIKYKLRQAGHINVGTEIIVQAISSMCSENTMRSGLRGVAKRILSVDPKIIPRPTKQQIEMICSIAQYISVLRGAVSKDRYTKEMLCKPTSEVGTRLAKQLCALAMGISIYKRDSIISPETLTTITKVAKDTAPDLISDIIYAIYKMKEPATANYIAERARLPRETVFSLLEDLYQLRALIKESAERHTLYRLNNAMLRLIEKGRIYS